MKITIDCSKAINERAGVARYNWQLARKLPDIGCDDQFFYYFNFLRGNTYKNDAIKKLIAGHPNVTSKIIRLPGSIKDKLYPSSFSLSQFFIPRCDLVHAVDFIVFDRGIKVPQIVTIHDLSLIRFPQHQGEKASFNRGKMLSIACHYATKIIAVSESTKRDIVHYFKIPQKKIEVIYQGTSDIFKPIKDNQKIIKKIKQLGINDPYLLFVGTIEPRKNIINLLKAYEKVKSDAKNVRLKLVLAGKKGWNAEDVYEYAKNCKYSKDIIFLNYVTDDDLLYLYNGAILFCYPSIYEGFGIPVLEALKCAKPVVTSNTSSLPEVGGDAVLYADPLNPNDIARNIFSILNNDKLREKLSQKAIRQAEKFSWDKCANLTYQLYKKTIYENQ